MLYKIINTYADESDFILNLIDDHPYIGWYMLLRLGESDTTKATLTRRECIEIIRKDGSYARNIFSYVYKAVDITVGNIQEKADSIFGTAYEHILLNGLEILSRFASIANITEQKKLVVLMIILTFIITLSASQPSVSNTFNQTLQVNNYYVINMGYDVSELNMDNFRIVNCDVVVRLKHNCHSKIVEQLREGQIIKIIGKYKKWRQVVWKNEEDELCMGWIQNYNLTKFKLTRSARNIKKIKV